jgi:hypothetical protein
MALRSEAHKSSVTARDVWRCITCYSEINNCMSGYYFKFNIARSTITIILDTTCSSLLLWQYLVHVIKFEYFEHRKKFVVVRSIIILKYCQNIVVKYCFSLREIL